LPGPGEGVKKEKDQKLGKNSAKMMGDEEQGPSSHGRKRGQQKNRGNRKALRKE